MLYGLPAAVGWIHSQYHRHLGDLLWEGIPVHIELRVRRFFCDTDACAQKIFNGLLAETTLALSGSAGVRLAKQLGILTSGSTLRRQLRCKTIEEAASSHVLGIDDWAWRKGHRCGTILCDLERGKVIDPMADRSAESTGRWLRAHPEAEIISRDRASLYAEAASKAAPQTVQVADRWHLPHSMTDALIGVLARQHRLLDEAARAVAPAETPAHPPPEMSALEPTPPSSTHSNSSEGTVNAVRIVMKSSWRRCAKACPSRRLRGSVAWAARRFTAGREPMDFRNAEPLPDTPKWKPTSAFSLVTRLQDATPLSQ